MSKQVNFFITPEDLPRIEQSLKGVEDFVVLANRSNGPRPKVLTGLDDPSESSLFLYLVRPQDLISVRMYEIENLGQWLVDVDRSPVIEFIKCRRDDKGLGRGRVYAQTSYYDEQDNLVRKDAGFLAWLDKVLRVVKRNLKKESVSSFFYLSPGARALQADGVTLKRL